MDFSKRAEKLRTPQQAKLITKEAERVEQMKGGKSAEQYWKENVRTKDDVIAYYQLYFPEYPDELCEAMATTLTRMLERANIDPLYRQAMMQVQAEKKKKLADTYWDFRADLEQSRQDAYMKICERNMDELLRDADEEEKKSTKKKQQK